MSFKDPYPVVKTAEVDKYPFVLQIVISNRTVALVTILAEDMRTALDIAHNKLLVVPANEDFIIPHIVIEN